VNVKLKEGSVTSLLLENPIGSPLEDLSAGLRALNIRQLFKDERRSSPVAVTQLRSLAGQTLYG
jgi:hypothetical protein